MDNKAIFFIKNLWEKTIAPSISTLIKKEKENADRIVEAIENKEISKKMTVSLDGVSVVTLKGDKGDPGKDGRDGKDGKDGKDGRPGRDGKDGKPGKDGEDGYTPVKGVDYFDGRDGKDGKDGRDGIDGNVISPEEVRDKLAELQGNERLDAKYIKNLPVSYGGGGFSDLRDAGDVRIVNPTNGQALKYNSTTGKWENGTVSGSGAVDSVNGQTGAVVLDTDDISEGATKKYNQTHTGDVTGATTLTIANDTVTNAKLANMATQTIKGRTTAGTGDPEDLTAAQVRTILNVADGATAYTDEMAQDAVGSMIADTATIDLTYTDATPELKADVKDGSITYAKIQNVSATDKLLGRSTAGAGSVEEIACTAAGRSMIGAANAAAQTALLDAVVGDSGSGGTKGLVPAPAAGDAAAGKFLKADGSWTAPSGSGDVVGPASATDNAIARYDGTTGKLIQNSSNAIIDDDGFYNNSGTFVFSSGDKNMVNLAPTAIPTASGNFYFYKGGTTLSSGDEHTGAISTMKFDITKSGGGRSANVRFVDANYYISGSGETTELYLFKGDATKGNSGKIGTAYGLHLNINNSNATNAIDNLYYIRLVKPTATGTITNEYGMYLEDMNTGTNSFAILTNAGNVVFNEGGDPNTDFRVEGDTDVNLLFTDASTDRVGIGANDPATKLDVNSDSIRIRTAKTPASATDTGVAGQIAWDANYIYVCTATNTWKRAAISTW